MTELTIPDERLLVDAPAAARLLSVSVRTLANLTARAELPSVRIGRSLRYSVDELKRFVHRRQDSRSAPDARIEAHP